MADFTRLTIIGTARKADLVIPSDEAIAGLLPRLMDLLGEPAGSVARPLSLVRTTGEQLDVGLTAADQEIEDGELLRFVRADDAPPPPEVADVTDVLGESLSERRGLWSTESRHLTGALALGALSVAAAALVPAGGVGRVVFLAGVVLAAVVFGRLGARWGAVALTAIALGACLPISLQLAHEVTRPGAERYGLAVAVLGGLGWLVLAAGFGVGVGLRPALWGGLVGLVLATLPLVLRQVGFGLFGAVGITAAVAVVVCGVLPRYAMTASGLTGLDDQVVEGHLRRRDEVVQTVNEAYHSLTWTTYAVAVPLAATAAWLLASVNRWAVGLGLLVIVITALRTRAFPLTAQQLPLWLAVLAGTIVGLVRQPALNHSAAALLLIAAAALAVVLVVARPPSHQRAFWRRTGNLVEALAVVALIPILLGMFGVYHDLLGAFKR